MKKAFAIILTFSIIFLCACNSKGKSTNVTNNGYAPTPLTSAIPTTLPTTQKVVITDWPTSLLPEKFPAPPEDTHAFEVAKGNPETDEGNFVSEWVRIRFTCPEQNFHTFTNEFINLGYKGSSKKISEGTYFNDGYKGYWQNGEYLIRINDSYISADSNLSVVIDIVPYTDNFPSALSPVYPKFNGFTAGNGIYCGHDSNGNQISDTYDGTFDTFWHWEFRGRNCFVGVTLEEFEAYYETLGKMEFSGTISAALVDGCDMLSVDVMKTVGNTEYVCHMLYNQTLRTLDIAYSNDPSIYENQQDQ